jgi:CheY-like chemotaxis protein
MDSPKTVMIIENEPDAADLFAEMMPDISGPEVLRHMRSEPDMQAIPVIILSAKSTPGDIKAGFDAGATKYHTKPVSFLDLKQAVTQVLQKV